MGIFRQLAEYLYLKKKDPNASSYNVDEIYARDEQDIYFDVSGSTAGHPV